MKIDASVDFYCSRVVQGIKPAHNSSKKFWQQVFEKIENETSIPIHLRLSTLKEVLPDHLQARVIKILTKEILPKYQPGRNSQIIAMFRRSILGEINERRQKLATINFRETLTNKESTNADTTNIYTRFMTLPESVAARWRPLPPRTFHGMNLNEKCEALTLAIASEFVEWLKGLGGDEATILDVPVILNLFEIGFNAHAADSLCVRIKELNAVTKSVALENNMPEASYTAKLYQQLYRDINSVKTRDEMFAFGTMLPPEIRSAPQKDNIAVKWIKNKRVPEKIANMAIVWEGIEHLRSTRGYCNWLMENPEIEPPKYLLKAGLLERKLEISSSKRILFKSDSDEEM